MKERRAKKKKKKPKFKRRSKRKKKLRGKIIKRCAFAFWGCRSFSWDIIHTYILLVSSIRRVFAFKILFENHILSFGSF